MDIDNKLSNYLKMTGIINNMYRPQKTKENKTTIVQYTGHLHICYMVVKTGPLN